MACSSTRRGWPSRSGVQLDSGRKRVLAGAARSSWHWLPSGWFRWAGATGGAGGASVPATPRTCCPSWPGSWCRCGPAFGLALCCGWRSLRPWPSPCGCKWSAPFITRQGIGTDGPSTLISNRSDAGIGLITKCGEAGGQVLPRPLCSISGRGCCSPDLACPSPSRFQRAETTNRLPRSLRVLLQFRGVLWEETHVCAQGWQISPSLRLARH